MSDRRVVRGNTFAARPILPSEDPQNRLQTTRFAKTKLYHTKKRSSLRRPVEEPVVDEKASHEYLEELTDIPLAEDFSAQTEMQEAEELFSVPFVPKPRGDDKETWIEELEMFDFESSVEPVLEVLIGKSMEQGLMEVSQEEEIKVLNTHKDSWVQKRNVIHTEAQRLLVEKRRHEEELNRRLAQARENALQQKIEQHERDARTVAKNFFNSLHDMVLQRLAAAGHFYDPVQNQVENTFMPFLKERVQVHLDTARRAAEDVDRLVKDAIALGQEQVVEATRARAELAERLRLEEEQRILEEERRRRAEEEEAARQAAMAAEEENEGDEEAEDY
jgi:hypothetical protein